MGPFIKGLCTLVLPTTASEHQLDAAQAGQCEHSQDTSKQKVPGRGVHSPASQYTVQSPGVLVMKRKQGQSSDMALSVKSCL